MDTSIVVLKFVGLALESSGVRLASLFEAQYRWTLSFSGGAGFSRAHENNGAGRELCDAMGDAANQQAIQSGEAARRKHDRIALGFSCRRNYLFRRLTDTDLKAAGSIMIGSDTRAL